jgi:exopolysaccharide biosynthesis WecB/TagA/CpsF family protein
VQAPAPLTPEKKNVVGILVDPLDREAAIELIIEAAREPRPFAVSAIAVHGVMTGVLDSSHRYRLNNLDLVVADGQPVRWALNHIYEAGLKYRVYGPDLTYSVLARAEQEGLPVYFYGSKPDVLEALCATTLKTLPRLKIAGCQPSAFGRITAEEADNIARKIRQSGARIVFAGLGCPRQEVWAYEFRNRLNLPIVAVGAAFPFLAGTLRQAPVWMQDSGLEWLFRLCTEPRRLWRRYLVLSPAYLALVFCQWMGMKFDAESEPPQAEILYG